VIVPDEVATKRDFEYQGMHLIVPVKKPKGKPLSEKAKVYNRAHNSERMMVEHVIGKMKFFRILSDRFRNPLNTHALIFKNVSGLCNVMFTKLRKGGKQLSSVGNMPFSSGLADSSASRFSQIGLWRSGGESMSSGQGSTSCCSGG